MGLDFVELVIGVERRFNVTLDDAGVTKCETVGDFVAMAAAAIARSGVPVERGLERVRTLLARHIGVAREDVRPDVRLVDLVPIDRRYEWRQLVAEDSRVPALFAPPFVELCNTLLVVLGFVLVAPCMIGSAIANGALIWGSLGSLALLLVVRSLLVRKYRVHFPSGLATVGDLVRVLTPADPASDGDNSDEAWVFAEVREILARMVLIESNEILPTMRFSKLFD